MSDPTDARKDPLAPIEFAVTLVSTLLVLGFALIVPLTVFGSGSVLGIGEDEACTTTRTGVVGYFVTDTDRPSEGVEGLRADARSWPERLEICNQAPSVGVKAAAVGHDAAGLLFLIGFLVLARRLIRTARADALFGRTVAARTRGLGWYLLLGSLAVSAVSALTGGVVLGSAVDGVGWPDGLRDFDVPWTLVIVAIGVLTFARVLRRAVALQDDVDATI